MRELAGKVALVTGGSRGMGAEIARALARQGASVALTYRSAGGAAAVLVAELTTLGATTLAIRVDHRRDAETRDAVGNVIARFGRIDILVNNAGIFPYGAVAETAPETMSRGRA